MARIAKGTHSAARHSLLDELTFNRDFDLSDSTNLDKKWVFHPSYSGFASAKVRTAQTKRLPVNLMDTFLSDTATTPQIVPTELAATRMRIKSNPTLRGFVTDKITTLGYEPAVHSRAPLRTSCSKLVHDHQEDLLVNITTPSPYKFLANSPPFKPLGSLQPAVQVRSTSGQGPRCALSLLGRTHIVLCCRRA